MLGASHQLPKICPADADEMGVVAAFEIESLLSGQAVVQPVCGAERRDRARLAIRKQRLDLLLAGEVPSTCRSSSNSMWREAGSRASRKLSAPLRTTALTTLSAGSPLAAALSTAVSVCR
jgi:hypothetical protein